MADFKIQCTRGERSPTAKLSLASAQAIWDAKGKVRCQDLAAQYGVHPRTVYAIWRRISWPEIKRDSP